MAAVTPPLYPALFQINTRIWLQELSEKLGRPANLDDVEDATLDRIAALGFDWVWPLGVWQTGPAGRQISRTQPQWREEYQQILPDLRDEDICGSPFAIVAYTANTDFGGDAALARLRERLRQRGLRLLLDFVPNHTALDHPWAFDHLEYYVQRTENDLANQPRNYVRVETRQGQVVLAHGRDPYFPGWPDTLQLNYRHPALREAMVGELLNIASKCDAVRCDMAMLILPDVFQRTWGSASTPRDGVQPVDTPFWPEATTRVRERFADFVFMAEVYWDLEYTLQQQGFDYTYDKRLYDRLHAQDAGPVLGHLHADAAFQRRSVRFLENHDEPRAAAMFPLPVHLAAGVVAFTVPGLRFFHEGEFEGRKVKLSVHLGRRPKEAADPFIEEYYARLLDCLRRPELRDGRWQLLDCRPAWDGNQTSSRFLVSTWLGSAGQRLLVCVNYGPTQGQCYVSLPLPELRGKQFVLRDLMGPACFERNGDGLVGNGLYLDMPAWGYHIFEMKVMPV